MEIELKRDWLEALQRDLYQRKEYVRPTRSTGPAYYLEARRRLTTAEWADIQELLKSTEFFCQMSNSHFGFELAMSIYGVMHYPGTPPTFLLWLMPEVMPWWTEAYGSNQNTSPAERWSSLWNAFEPLTHSEKNRAALEFHRMDPPREMQHYEY